MSAWIEGLLRWPTLDVVVAHHERLRVDEAEGVDDDLALDRLDGVDDDGDGARCELLKRLLRVDVDRRQPAAEAGM
jgi:hypothetical protein